MKNQMLHQMEKYWKPAVSVLVGMVIAMLLGTLYWGHLAAHEQYQCFMYTQQFALHHLFFGGPVLYVSEWLVQFFMNPSTGACLVALLLMLLQVLTWGVANSLKSVESGFYAVSFLPSLALLWSMMDGDVLLSLPVAAVLWMGAAWLTLRPDKLFWQLLLGIVLAALLLVATWPSDFVYYRLQQMPCARLTLPMIACVASPILLIALASKKCSRLEALLLWVVILVGGSLIVSVAMDSEQEETMEYNQMAHEKAWDKIILRAKTKGVKSREAGVCVNLALAMRGQLGDNLHLAVTRWGDEVLLPEFRGEWRYTMTVSDAFYYLGLVNTAQRYAFNAQEAIPNMNKSARCMKMLAETNIVNGDYRAARKYLHHLEHTLYYRAWARDALYVIGDEQHVEEQPMWNRLRHFRLQDDLLVNGQRDRQLRALIQQDSTNYLAVSYAMAYLSLMQQNNMGQ